MFYGVGNNFTTWTIDVSRWDVSKVTKMGAMFAFAGVNTTNFTLDLSRWDTSSVTDINYMFANVAQQNTGTVNINLSGWDTSNVTKTSGIFNGAALYATSFALNLSGWNTSKVTDFNMFTFSGMGSRATTWSAIIPATNGGGINNTPTAMYGSSESVYAPVTNGKTFTLASQ
jgi:surface protein